MISSPSGMLQKSAASNGFSMKSAENERTAGSMPVWDSASSFAANLARSDASNPENTASFGLGDILDMVNPLHHIPVVSNFYESATGDHAGTLAKIGGGALFGGPVGAAVSAGIALYQAARRENETTDNPLSALDGTTVALADLRAGQTPYNT